MAANEDVLTLVLR